MISSVFVSLLKSKVHRATVTDSSVDYSGSLGLDVEWMELVGLTHYEKILVGNITTGSRFETYVIPETRGSRTVSVKGAAAHRAMRGDLLVIMSFALAPTEAVSTWKPKAILLSETNTKLQWI